MVPLYDFVCRSCGNRFEARASVDDLPACPACGEHAVERRPSRFAGPFTVAQRGLAARRSDASRRAREEQRRERQALRREAAAGGSPRKIGENPSKPSQNS